jgi:hypothetical protein
MPAGQMTRFPFTEARLRGWPQPESGWIRLRDAACPGLACYVTPTARVFYFRSKADEMANALRYVFPAALAPGKPSPQPHVTDPKASWRRVLLKAGLVNLRPHDLRRSIGSWMALGGVGLPIIGAALGHRDAKSTTVYARLNDGAVRQAMERATAAMLAAGDAARPEPPRLPGNATQNTQNPHRDGSGLRSAPEELPRNATQNTQNLKAEAAGASLPDLASDLPIAPEYSGA